MVWFVANLFTAAVVLIGLPFLVEDFIAYTLALYFLYAIAALGLGIAWGQAGLLSLGQGFFVGLGAYFSGLALVHFVDSARIWPLLALSMIVPGLLAYLIGRLIFQGRRQNGAFFALITLALVLLASQIATSWNSVTGGFNGLLGIPGIPGLDGFEDAYTLSAIGLFVAIAIFAWLRATPLAVLWQALAQDERRVAFLGFDPNHLKAIAFGISGVFGGLAGTLYAPENNIVTPDLFGFALSTNFVLWVAIGGRATLYGPVLGAIGIGMLTASLRESIASWELILAAIFIFSVLYFREGIVGLVEPKILRWLRGVNARLRFAPVRRITAPNSLKFDAVSLSAGEVRILDTLSFDVPDPGIYCLIGPNGAGKTTIFNALTGELPKRSGNMHIMGKKVLQPNPTQLTKQGLGRKFQIPAVFDALTVGENLSIALWCGRVHTRDLLRFSAMNWTSETLSHLEQSFGFLAKRDRMVRDLSHGERQILDLAMVLAMEPRVILLDEPCAGLSVAETAQVAEIIRWATEQFGATTLVIEHDMALVERLASKVFVLHQGRLLAEGSVAEIKRNDAVRAVYAGGQK